MVSKRAVFSTVAAGALALAVTAAPRPAHAFVWWVVPAIAAGVVGGVAVGATAANASYAYGPGPYDYDYTPRGTVYVRPTCHLGRVQGPDGYWRRARVCP